MPADLAPADGDLERLIVSFGRHLRVLFAWWVDAVIRLFLDTRMRLAELAGSASTTSTSTRAWPW